MEEAMACPRNLVTRSRLATVYCTNSRC